MLAIITTNLLREHWRARPHADAAVRLEQLSDPDGGLSRFWDEQHDRHVLRRLMDLIEPMFEPSTLAAFRRVAYDGVAPARAAEELGLSLNAVLLAKSRVLRRLREETRGWID